MRWLFAITSFALSLTAYGQEDAGEKLFRAMEKKVRAAKAMQLVCEVEGRLSAGGEQQKIKANQQFAGPNKARIELHSGSYNSLFVSDGNMALTREGVRLGEPKKADPQLNEGLTGTIALGGFMLPRLILRREAGRFNADTTLLISEFKLGAKERVGTVDAQAVQYSVKFGGLTTGPAEKVVVTVWIDPKTQLPLKRKVIVGNQEADYFTEVYTEFVIDPKLDAKVFELPK
jgi:outer membrane lipoprotein-sorting protein